MSKSFGGLAAVAAVSLLMALPAQGDEYKIGVLHVERILQQSSSAKAAHDRIEQEFKARDADIGRKEQEVRDAGAQLEKTRATLSADARTAQERTLEARTREVQRLRQVFARRMPTRGRSTRHTGSGPQFGSPSGR